MTKNTLTETATKKAVMLTAIEANYGNITRAAAMAKITPNTHYVWLKEDRGYADQAENMKDLGFRKIKDNLLDMSMKMAEKGNVTVLNKLLGIYFKGVPEEISKASRHNNVPLRMGINFVSTREEAERIMGGGE
jgi:DNA-binding protein Fis